MLLLSDSEGGFVGRPAMFPYFWVMWGLTSAFALRVAGQAVQCLLPFPFLPPFTDWQGSDMPYSVLLLLQLVILGLMAQVSWRVNGHLGSRFRHLVLAAAPNTRHRHSGFGAFHGAP